MHARGEELEAKQEPKIPPIKERSEKERIRVVKRKLSFPFCRANSRGIFSGEYTKGQPIRNDAKNPGKKNKYGLPIGMISSKINIREIGISPINKGCLMPIFPTVIPSMENR